MAFPASIPELSERADPCAYHNTSFNVFAYGQRALNDGVNRVDRALTFWYSEALDWHFHLFSELNQKPLPFSVAARLSIEEPGGETSDKTLPNRFRVTGTVTVPQRNCHLLRYGNRIPILGWEIRLSATDSVKIFSVIASTDDNAEALAEPESVPLHTTAYQSLQDDKVTLPVSWESLQFQLPTHNSENDRNPVRSFFVRLQVVATVFSPNQITISQARAGPFVIRHASKCLQPRPLDAPLSETDPASADARLRLPAGAHTTPSESSHGRSLPDVSSSQSNLPSQAKDTAMPENKATKTAVGPPSRLRECCRRSPYSSSTTSIRQRKANRGILGGIHRKSRRCLSDSGDDTT